MAEFYSGGSVPRRVGGNMRQKHRENRYAASRPLAAAIVALLASLSPQPAIGDELLVSAPTERLSNVLPLRVLDSLELPPAPIRVAARPTLDWRPGLSATSKDLAKSSELPAEKSTEKEAAPVAPLKPVIAPPLLVAPNADAEPIEEAAPEAKPTPAKNPAVTKKTEQLPLRKPKTVAPRELKPTPKERAPATQPPAEPKPEPKAKIEKKTPAVAPESEATETAPKKVAPAKPAEPPQPLTRGLRNLRSRMRTVLSFYYRQPLNTLEHDPWELMHGMLAYELHSRVRDGGPRGPFMTSIGHLCFNRASKRQQMMAVDGDGRLDVRVGVGLQGHKGQLLAMLAQCNVSPEYPIRVEGRDFTIRDLIESEQRSCYAKTELTFKLIGLGHYLGSDARWLNDQGESWDIPRLIREEREQPIRGAACGGTHRLAGLSLAYRRREARGEPIDGEYAEAARFVSQYQTYAFQLQNADGSLSTEWFRGRGDEEDIDRRLRTTGHLLEWLVYSLPDDQLRSYRTVKAVNYLTNLLAGNADHEWHLGSIGHAIHALVLYDKRVFRPHDDDNGQIAGSVDPTGRLFRGYPIYRNVMRNSPPKPSGIFGLFGGSRTGSAAGRQR
ncbi:MAG: hypothetical protein AAF266_00485 [Planctomycetota bacterium]